MSLETRARAIETRADNGRKIGGYAAVFNSPTEIAGEFREVIAPGAFKTTLKGDIRALVNHDSGRVIGRSASGTLRLKEDDKGLAVEIDLPDTGDGRDLATLIERGDVSGMSFGFIVTKQSWDETGDMPTRTIEAVDLMEVSVVAFPAYDDTSIAMRSFGEFRTEMSRHNFKNAARRVSERKARQEARFRGL